MTDPDKDKKDPHMSAVGMKLPPFWPNDPTIWFAQIEAQFTTRGITAETTKYAHVVASLQAEIAQEVRDLLIKPPAIDPYQALKKELIRRTSASEQKRLHQLLISEELGDRKPSQLLRRMRQLLGENTLEDSILRQLFLQRLPTNAQLILASSGDAVTIDQLAVIADKIAEVTPTPQAIAAVATPPPPAAFSESAELRSMIASLAKQVESLSFKLNERGNQRGRSPNRRGSGNRRRSSSSANRSPSGDRRASHVEGPCYYHWRFGKEATKCRSPCTFSDSNQSNQQQSNHNASN